MTIRPILSSLLVAVSLGGCALPEMSNNSGESRADSHLKTDLIEALNISLPTKTGCQDRIGLQNIKKTFISRPLDQGFWQEIWTVEACGKSHDVQIDFLVSPEGGTDFSISLD